MQNVPEFNLDVSAFTDDPYPQLKRMRMEFPLAYVPQLDAVLLTRHADIVSCEKNTEVFSSHQPGGLMNRLMGHNMMRKDGKAHMSERLVLMPMLNAGCVKNKWLLLFDKECSGILDKLQSNTEAELVNEFAMVLSSAALKALTGLHGVDPALFDSWSQAMMDGIANYQGVAEVEQRCLDAVKAIEEAIDRSLPFAREHPQDSLLSAMVTNEMPIESIYANIKLVISGGQNEPRDAIAGTIWALLSHPEQLESVIAGRCSWQAALGEYLRWQSPIGMSPRRIAKEFSIHGGVLEPKDRVFLMFGSANHDEDVFADVEAFDVERDLRSSIAFGAGPHFCVGSSAAKALIADVALPAIFDRLKNLQLAGTEKIKPTGWAFRGLSRLPVKW